MESISVVIVEDQDFFADEYSARVKSDSKLSLINAYKNANSVLAVANAINPNIAIIDIGLPDMPGYELIKQLRLFWPNCQFLVCSIHAEDDLVFNAICNGATGYLLKTATEEEFLQAIQDLHNGGSPMSFQIARKVMEFVQTKSLATQEVDKLTQRELQIVELLSKGLRYKEIAADLSLSHETVRKHINNIYRKLEVQSRTEAINKLYPR
ncbi:MAG: response regulator transcription factor [Sphingobacteriales bacterium JAD_PAG50586_3]|nr:MAG: response regulator transcription factor [Sphingobacteriales bacterium JAD_PAG50586_3]